jgi:type VI protein secretion system component Hcp
MTSTPSLSDTNRSTSTHNKTLATDSTDNLRSVTDSELDLVVGGVVKLTDASSAKLHEACCRGTHIPEVTIEL